MKKLIETHGKSDGGPTMLEQVFGGFNEFSKYGTVNENEYDTQLKEMTRADLESHARKMGTIIHEDSVRIKNDLLKEFRNYVAYLRKPTSKSSKQPKISKDIKSILAEGR